MSIIDNSVKKPVAMSMLLSIVMAVGIYSSLKLPVDFLPDLEFPTLTITTDYVGAGPEEVEVAVTRPLENVLSTVENVDTITSTSLEGSSIVRLEFVWGTDLDQAMFNVREKIDLVRSHLPDGADSPQIFKFSSDVIPVLGVIISGIDDLATAYDLAENQIKKALEQIPGVGQVNISGGVEREVHIELSQNRLQAYNLDADTVSRIVSGNDISASGGYVYQGLYKFGVRTDAELKSLEDFRNIVVTYRSGSPILLSDIAEVYYGGNEDNPLMFLTGPTIEDESDAKPGRGAVILEITKSSGANTIEVERLVQRKLKELQRILPPSVQITEFFNTANNINNAMKGVTDSAIQGGLFALLVIFFYLWDWRSVLVIGLSIPTSIIATFIAMYAAGASFNVISMAGLTLAIGMMVDSSIVVLENIFRHRSEGQGKYGASINGAKEVGLAITASTFTTIAVFAPILFVEGQTSVLFRDLVVTVVVGLLASLIISITLVPMLCSILIKEVHMDAFDADENMTDDQASKMRFNDRILHQVDMVYKQGLEWCVRHKKLVVYGGNLLVIALLVFFIIIIPKESQPSSDDGEFNVYLTFPVGTRYEYNEQISRQIIKSIRETIGNANLKLIGLQVKTKKGIIGFGSAQEHKSQIRVVLVPKTERTHSVSYYADEVRAVLQQYPVKTYISLGNAFGGGGGGGGEPIHIQIQGNDLDVNNKVAEQLIAILDDIPDINNARNTSDDGVPEVVLRPDRVALAKAGISPTELFSIIGTAFGGKVATTVLGPTGNDIDVRVRVRDQDRISIDSLLNMSIPLKAGGAVPLNTLVEAVRRTGPAEIKRQDSVRVIDIRASTGGAFKSDIPRAVEAIQSAIAERLFIPSGVRLLYKGDFEDTQENNIAIFGAFFVAIFIVYALMAAQFESYIAPFVIMISIPFGALGSTIMLFLTGHSLSLFSSIGIVILVGIVINNGIVLIDYMNQLLAQEMPVDEAAVQAGIRRIRPVCMTTFTTILGMGPMALGLGEGGETYAPLATSVIGGLILSTVFTLLVVPVAYAGIRKRFPYDIKKDIQI